MSKKQTEIESTSRKVRKTDGRTSRPLEGGKTAVGWLRERFRNENPSVSTMMILSDDRFAVVISRVGKCSGPTVGPGHPGMVRYPRIAL